MKTGDGLEKIGTGGLRVGTNTGCLGAVGFLVCTNTLGGLVLTGRLVVVVKTMGRLDVECTLRGLVLIGLMVVVIIIGGGRYGGGTVVVYRLVQGCQGRDVVDW